MFESYVKMLETNFSKQFETVCDFGFEIVHRSFFLQIVSQDDHVPMQVEEETDLDTVLDVVWLDGAEKEEIKQQVLQILPKPHC